MGATVPDRFGVFTPAKRPNLVVINGTIPEWEEWTGMRFLESGAYVVPGALQPVMMDLERDLGSYEEPNVWMRHPVTAES